MGRLFLNQRQTFLFQPLLFSSILCSQERAFMSEERPPPFFVVDIYPLPPHSVRASEILYIPPLLEDEEVF